MEKQMKTKVNFNSELGRFEVTVYYAAEASDERLMAARKALRDAKVPECVKQFKLFEYQMNRWEANPHISEFFRSAGINLSEHDVARMDWHTINELIRYVRSKGETVTV
jgi:hypothetical protein